jgi:prepilin signal peptidase PulO-like enzyme (type II secretory pathway)
VAVTTGPSAGVLVLVALAGALGGVAAAELSRRVPARSADELRWGRGRHVVGAMVGALLLVADARWVSPVGLGIVVGCWMLALEAVSLVDAECHLLPRKIVTPALGVVGVGLAALSLAEGRGTPALDAAIGAVVGFVVLFALYRVTRGGIGFGDVRLAALCGAVEGFVGLDRVAVAILVGFVAAGVVSLLLVGARRATLRSAIPFGPFLALGAVVSVVFGPNLLR